MHGTTRVRPTIHPGLGVNAVVWIEPGRAIVLRGSATGEPATFELPIPETPGAMPPALADVAHRVGDVDHLLVLGTTDLRTAFEREVVAIGHHPETIREEIVTGPIDRAWLLQRLRRLA